MKRILINSFVFLFGLVVGLVLYTLAFNASLIAYKDLVRENLAREERYRAVRAERVGDMDNAVFHQKNSIRFSKAENSIVFSSNILDEDKFLPLKPISYLMLANFDKVFNDGLIDSTAKKGESLERGYLAYLLEKNGQFDAAAKELRSAAESDLANSDIDQKMLTIKNDVENRGWIMSPDYLKAEEMFLGKPKK